MKFNPCLGGMNCTQDGTHCQGCGRSHEEIAATKKLTVALADHVMEMDYENIEEFLQFVAFRTLNQVQMRKMEG